MASKRHPNIYPRTTAKGEQRYDAMLTFHDPLTGQRVQKMRTFKTLKEARDALAENRASLARGEDTAPSKMTVAQLAREWLPAHQPHIKPTSYEAYKTTLEDHIVPQLGALRVSALTARRLEQHYGQLQAEGVGPYAVEKTHQRLVQLLGYARRHGLVRSNVALDAAAPPHPKREMRCWDDQEMGRFLQHATQSPYGPVWSLALTTGLRRGELLALRWEDIDWERGTLTVAQSRVVLRRGMLTQTPKSGKRRTVSLAPRLLQELRAHQRQQRIWRLAAGAAWQQSDLVFTGELGEALHPNRLWRDLTRVCAAASVPRIRMHDLRHSHASWMLRHKRSVREVSERLGHASTHMTLNVYAHAVPDEHKETARMLDTLLARG